MGKCISKYPTTEEFKSDDEDGADDKRTLDSDAKRNDYPATSQILVKLCDTTPYQLSCDGQEQRLPVYDYQYYDSEYDANLIVDKQLDNFDDNVEYIVVTQSAENNYVQNINNRQSDISRGSCNISHNDQFKVTETATVNTCVTHFIDENSRAAYPSRNSNNSGNNKGNDFSHSSMTNILQQPDQVSNKTIGNENSSWTCRDHRGEQQVEGQAESKKHMKKHDVGGGGVGNGGGECVNVETKGTAMSFGFRKKLNTTPKKLKKLLEGDNGNKKKDKCNNMKRCAENTSSDFGKTTAKKDECDKNGNTMAAEVTTVNFEKMSAAAAERATASPLIPEQQQQQQHKHDFTQPEATRFGFRGTNIPRPAFAGQISRYPNQNFENNNYDSSDNNIYLQSRGLVSNLKRRSKSAHAGRIITSTADEQINLNCGNGGTNTIAPKIAQPKSITFNLNQNSTIEYQRQQYFQQSSDLQGRNSVPLSSNHRPLPQYQASRNRPNVINTGMHTNVIVRPPPRAHSVTSYSKFTLQTVNLPKPEFAVAISVSATTPTTPGTSSFSMVSGNRSGHHHPLTAVHTQPQSSCMETKNAKQFVNNNMRRGFTGSREISADSGIASIDMALDNNSTKNGSPKRSRSRPRNLQMVMNGRHKFEVRDLDLHPMRLGAGNVEPLTLPKLPLDNQKTPLPLNGLVRSNTVLSRENYEHKTNSVKVNLEKNNATRKEFLRNSSEETDSYNEEKLHLDRSTSEKPTKFRDINTISSKTSSPGSSIMSSWCNGGESLAVKDCSSMSISSNSEISHCQNKPNKLQLKHDAREDDLQNSMDDDLMSTSEVQNSTVSSITENIFNEKQMINNLLGKKQTENAKREHPKTLFYEQKFAEMALVGSAFLLDDETSPTDSLVSSTESDEAAVKQKKHKINAELQEKDIDEILPELDASSPISPGTPTHASHSLSLSDCGNLIDDEIADQPALLFDMDTSAHVDEENLGGDCSDSARKEKTDTPTLMETSSFAGSLRKKSKALSALQQAIELSLRTPLALRKAVMDRAESLDTLSPTGSMCSDDMIMDFEMSSSVDSIDRNKSRSGSDLNMLHDDATFFAQLESKSSNILSDLNNMTRSHSSRNSERESVISRLPARATRLLNRSRLQCQSSSPNHKIYNNYNNNNTTNNNNNNNNNNNKNNRTAIDSDSGRSVRSGGSNSTRSTKSASNNNNNNNNNNSKNNNKNNNNKNNNNNSNNNNSVRYLQRSQNQQQIRERNASQSSLDDLMLYDKSFRNAMIQDVLQFKKQLLRLRRILQETETRNPFESDNNGEFMAFNGKLLDDLDLTSLTSSTGSEDPLQELTDLRRQVVYLQSQVEDRERTIRLQQQRIDSLESGHSSPQISGKSCINSATQTERTRTYLTGSDALSRSKTELTSYTTTHFASLSGGETALISQQQPQQFINNFELKPNSIKGHHLTVALAPLNQQTRRHTIISTTLSNYNRNSLGVNNNNNNNNSNNNRNLISNRRSSFAWEKPTDNTTPSATTSVYKPVKITLIGEPLNQLTNGNQITYNNGTTTQNGIIDKNDAMLNSKQQQHNNGIPNGVITKLTYNNNNNKIHCNGKNDNSKKELRTTIATKHHHQQQQHLLPMKTETTEIRNNQNNNNNNISAIATTCQLNNVSVTIV